MVLSSDLRAPGRLRSDGAQAPPCWGFAQGGAGPGAALPQAQRLTHSLSVFPSLFPPTSPFVLKCTKNCLRLRPASS